MESLKQATMTVEAELRSPIATAQLVYFDMVARADNIMLEPDAYRIDLCLTPRPENARAGYRERWGPHRFERIGDIFLVPPGEALHVRSESGRQASILCRLQTDLVRDWMETDVEWTDRRLEDTLDITNINIRRLLARLAEETRHPGFASDMLFELIVSQLAIELGRHYSVISDAPAAGGLAAWRLRLIDERVTEMSAAPTLAELAHLCNMSVRQLTRGFRASRGCSIGDYLEQRRIENAKRLLGAGETVKTIAYAMGFSSPSSFSYAFRRATGAAPRQFRQRQIRVPG